MYKLPFSVFQSVRYTGSQLSGEIGNKIGEVVLRIPTGGYVVEFGNGSYVIDDNNLVKHNFADHEKGPEIVRRRKHDDEE